eukprot:8097211-Alexandrium_andersonii.AAC.1
MQPPIAGSSGPLSWTQESVKALFDFENTFGSMFHRACNVTWSELLVADPAEIEAEQAWAKNRPGVRSRFAEGAQDEFSDPA